MTSSKAQVYKIEYKDRNNNIQQEEIYIADIKIKNKDKNEIVRRIKKTFLFENYEEEIDKEMIETELTRGGRGDDPTKQVKEIRDIEWLREDTINQY